MNWRRSITEADLIRFVNAQASHHLVDRCPQQIVAHWRARRWPCSMPRDHGSHCRRQGEAGRHRAFSRSVARRRGVNHHCEKPSAIGAVPKQSGFCRKRAWIAWSLSSSQRRRLIQPTLRRAAIVRAGVGRRQWRLRRWLRIAAGRRRNGRGGARGGGNRDRDSGRARGARSCASRRNDSGGAGSRSGIRRRIGRNILMLSVRHEFFVARCARPRWNILRHAAGPGRPTIGDESGKRRAGPKPETGAERHRQHQQTFGRAGRQIEPSMPWTTEANLRAASILARRVKCFFRPSPSSGQVSLTRQSHQLSETATGRKREAPSWRDCVDPAARDGHREALLSAWHHIKTFGSQQDRRPALPRRKDILRRRRCQHFFKAVCAATFNPVVPRFAFSRRRSGCPYTKSEDAIFSIMRTNGLEAHQVDEDIPPVCACSSPASAPSADKSSKPLDGSLIRR